jgi:hypothetical protein
MQQCTVTVQEKYVLFLDIVIIGLNKCFCFGIFLSDKMETKILKKAAYNVLDLWWTLGSEKSAGKDWKLSKEENKVRDLKRELDML